MSELLKLIGSLYNVTIDPQKYDDLLDLWERDFFDVPDDLCLEDNDKIDPRPAKINDAIENHFFRALTILELVRENRDTIPTVEQLVNADPLPTVILAPDRTVALINDSAKNILNLDAGERLNASIFEKQDIENIDKIIGELEYVSADNVLLVIKVISSTDEEPILFALSKVFDAQKKLNLLRLSTVQIVWDNDVGKTIKNIFNLTDAELDLAKRLVSGEKLADIAKAKYRSINTIRTQSKTLYGKTNLKTQSDLIRLFSALQHYSYKQNDYVLDSIEPPVTSGVKIKQSTFIERPDGRSLYYEVYGDPNGKPVLFLHGMISGTKLPQENIMILRRNKIKLICPHRAGFGYSDINRTKNKLDGFIADIVALLDHEKIYSCPVIGHLAGAYYAYLLANKISKRVERLRIINGVVPLRSTKQINQMNGRQRIIAYTAIYTPKLLPFLLKAAIAQIKKDGIDNMMDALFKQSKHDYELFQSTEIHDIITNGFQSCIAQGIQSFVDDTNFISRKNWDDLIAQCPVPIDVFHATEDPVIAIFQVHELIKRHSNLNFKELDGGQLILYKHGETLLNNL